MGELDHLIHDGHPVTLILVLTATFCYTDDVCHFIRKPVRTKLYEVFWFQLEYDLVIAVVTSSES